MAEKITSILHRLLFDNWPRKALSLALAVIIWLTVNHSLTSTKTLSNVAVRIVNLPPNKTIEGLHTNGLLAKKVALTLTGKRAFLNDLSSGDFEVVIDATNKPDEWIPTIGKKNLVPLTPELNISKGVSDVTHQRFIIHLTKLLLEKIPVLITEPIGEAPRGYKFLDIWPYRLTLTVSGPEKVVKYLKAEGQRLTFNLNNISKAELDALVSKKSAEKDEISFFVPNQWKQLTIPQISDLPLEIDDEQAKLLRIDFVRSELIPIDRPIPVTLFFPQEHLTAYNPETIRLEDSSLLKDVRGAKFIEKPLFARGVSHLFVRLARSMLQISITMAPQSDGKPLDWSVLFNNPRALENAYVAALHSDTSDKEVAKLLPALREEYLRNRFRSYMNHFELYTPSDTPLELDIQVQSGRVVVVEKER